MNEPYIDIQAALDPIIEEAGLDAVEKAVRDWVFDSLSKKLIEEYTRGKE